MSCHPPDDSGRDHWKSLGLAFFVLDGLQTAGVLSWSRLITRECICLPQSILAPLVVRYRQLWLSKPLGHGWISNRPRPRYLSIYAIDYHLPLFITLIHHPHFPTSQKKIKI